LRELKHTRVVGANFAVWIGVRGGLHLLELQQFLFAVRSHKPPFDLRSFMYGCAYLMQDEQKIYHTYTYTHHMHTHTTATTTRRKEKE
jgi:hypothetical protein